MNNWDYTPSLVIGSMASLDIDTPQFRSVPDNNFKNFGRMAEECRQILLCFGSVT